jgi:ABC-type oligopeptide transport system substrate-binding subunit
VTSSSRRSRRPGDAQQGLEDAHDAIERMLERIEDELRNLGTRRGASDVVAKGNTLTVRFKRAAPDFPALTTLPFFCAVPPTLPVDPEGIGVIPSAGPNRVTEYRPGERVALRRNCFYGGERPHHVDGFDVDLRAPSPAELVRRIEQGEADWGQNLAPVFLDPALGLVAKYGINESRFFLKPGLTLRMFALNSSRPLFRNNPGLRASPATRIRVRPTT